MHQARCVTFTLTTAINTLGAELNRALKCGTGIRPSKNPQCLMLGVCHQET